MFVVGHLLAVVGQVILAAVVMPVYAFAGQCHRAGHIVEMVVHMGGHIGQMVRGDLSRHVDGNPALQPQHHLVKRPVNIVDDIQMKSLL